MSGPDDKDNVTHALAARLSARRAAEQRQDDELYGVAMNKIFEGIVMRHTSNTLGELNDMHKAIEHIEGGLTAISDALTLSSQETIIERSRLVFEYALKFTELSRPHPYDSEQLRQGKFQFYRRVLALQKTALDLLETFTDIGTEKGPEKLNRLTEDLLRAGLITVDSRAILTEMIYPTRSQVIEFKR